MPSTATTMLQPSTNLLDHDLGDYQDLIENDRLDEIRQAGGRLAGLKVVHVNATAYGGGVAEILKSLIPLIRDAGPAADWLVLKPDQRLFAITKKLHNALQGRPAGLTAAERDYYLDYGQRLAESLDQVEADLLVIHDPQPLAAVPHLKRRRPSVGRIHIDMSEPEPQALELVGPLVAACDLALFSLKDFVPAGLDSSMIRLVPPAIDPFSVKNAPLPEAEALATLKLLGLNPTAPLISQVSRFDPWKDPLGVIEAFRLVRRERPEVQLVLAGSTADDDPEGIEVWQQVVRASAGLPNVFLFSNQTEPAVHDREINALQARSAVVIQKSLREGFGLTVTEALWKARPVVAGNAGGIRLQVQDGSTGFLVDSPEGCAQRVLELLADPALAARLGETGQSLVRQRFLMTRLLRDHLDIYGQLLNA